MTERKHKSTITCKGCGNNYGIIQQAHVDRCPGLTKLGITTRQAYSDRFGSTVGSDQSSILVKNIIDQNDRLTSEERKNQSKIAHKAAVAKHPDLYRMGGLMGSKGLWSKPGQIKRHTDRLIALNNAGLMCQEPNKLELFFWDLIGKEKIDYSSFNFWKTLHRDDGSSFNISPDFRIKKTKIVFEVYGNYWHKDEDPNVRVQQWNSVGYSCAVVWEVAIRKTPELVKSKIENFISRNLQERGAFYNLIVE